MYFIKIKSAVYANVSCPGRVNDHHWCSFLYQNALYRTDPAAGAIGRFLELISLTVLIGGSVRGCVVNIILGWVSLHFTKRLSIDALYKCFVKQDSN